MDFQLKTSSRSLILLAGLAFVLCGCSKSAEELDEMDDRHPMMEQADSKMRAHDIDGAIATYSGALQANPRLAKAHLQLGLIFDKKKDYIRAIYHYQLYLELRPNAQKKAMIEDLIRHARLSYAASLPDQPSGAVREIAELNSHISSLETDLANARERLGKMSASLREVQVQRVQIAEQAELLQAAGGEAAATSTSGPRSYKVRSGDNLSRIADKVYNDSSQWRKIFDANRATLKKPEDLKIGQVLTIP